MIDECGVCDGPGSIYDCGCEDLPIVDNPVFDGCDLPDDGNYLYLTQAGSVLYKTSEPIAGFQFDVSGTSVSNASGGDAEANGFTLERGVAGMPTAFVATYGEGRPVISVLGEFDALPGISQKAIPEKIALEDGAAGHGCGHNLFGTASLGAAVAIKNLISSGKLKGTVKFFGTPFVESPSSKCELRLSLFFKFADRYQSCHP